MNPLLTLYFTTFSDVNYIHLVKLLRHSITHDVHKTMSILLHMRNPGGPKGFKNMSRLSFQWVLINYPHILEQYITHIPKNGRWDDLLYLCSPILNLETLWFINTNYCSNITEKKLENAKKIQEKIEQYIIDALVNRKDTLCAKWMPSEKSSLDKRYNLVKFFCNKMKMSKKKYRKLLTSLRKEHGIIETYLCKKKYEISYENVPCKALKKYKKALLRNDPILYKHFLNEIFKDNNNNNSCKYDMKYLLFDYIICLHSPTRHSCDYVELYWIEFMEEFNKNRYKYFTPIIDISGSMYNNNRQPLNIALVVGLICQEDITIANSVSSMYIRVKNKKIYDIITQIRNISTINSSDSLYKILVNSDNSISDNIYVYISDIPYQNIFTKKLLELNKKIIYFNPSISGINMFNINTNTLIVQGFDNNIYKYILQTGIFNVNDYVTNITKLP
jgi:hypothetical protein